MNATRARKKKKTMFAMNTNRASKVNAARSWESGVEAGRSRRALLEISASNERGEQFLLAVQDYYGWGFGTIFSSESGDDLRRWNSISFLRCSFL